MQNGDEYYEKESDEVGGDGDDKSSDEGDDEGGDEGGLMVVDCKNVG